jgi:hypothetical protein
MISNTAERMIENSFRIAFDYLRRYVNRQIKDYNREGSVVLRDQFNIARMDNTIKTLRHEIDRLGYNQATITTLNILGEQVEEARKMFDDLELDDEFSTESETAIRMLLMGAEADLVAIAGDASNSLSDVLRRSVLGMAQFDDVLYDIERVCNIKQHQAITIAKSALHAFSSTIRVQHAREIGVKWFAYLGPDDEITRDWCGHWLGMRGTMDMFEDTSGEWGRENQPSPVSKWRGGWNCRHEFVPLVGKRQIERYPEGPR